MHLNRRAIFAALCMAGAVSALPAMSAAQDRPMKIAMLIPGHVDDGGFMEAGYNGLLAIESELGAEIKLSTASSQNPKRCRLPCANWRRPSPTW